MPILKQLQQHKILLDTHIFIWLMDGNQDLSHAFLKAINLCKSLDCIFISPISIWEIGMLVEKKRIIIEMDALDWVTKALNKTGINIIPISPQIAIQSTRLPGNVHGDPADRMIIASAHSENAVLVTCDEKILEYGNDRFISVYHPIKK